jgi:hypothetical protein
MPDSPATSQAPPQPERPRFSWPLRVFLFLVVFDMIYHSLAALLPYKDLCKELDMPAFPKALPTRAEMRELAAKGSPGTTDPVGERLMETADSLWEYFRPWPSAATRKKMSGVGDGLKFAYCWLSSRVGFFEQLVRFEQRWTMFSPNVVTDDFLARAKLVYRDGSVAFRRTSADPEDLTRYAHWFKEKVLEYETKLDYDPEARLGWCNLLAHRYPRSPGGAPLDKIYLIRVKVLYPAPDEEDIEGFMRRQSEDTAWKKKAPFWEYEVATRKGKRLADPEVVLGVRGLGAAAAPLGMGPLSAAAALRGGTLPNIPAPKK